MPALGQKRPKLPWLPAAKSTTEQRVKFVPQTLHAAERNRMSFDDRLPPGRLHTRWTKSCHNHQQVVDAMLRWPLGPLTSLKTFVTGFAGHIASIVNGLLAARIAPALLGRVN